MEEDEKTDNHDRSIDRGKNDEDLDTLFELLRQKTCFVCLL